MFHEIKKVTDITVPITFIHILYIHVTDYTAIEKDS